MKKQFVIIIICIVAFPATVGLLVSIPGLVPIKNDWIGFWGSFVGGIMTMIGVLLTIDFYKKQELKKEDQNTNHNLKLLYWHLTMQMEKISELNDAYLIGSKYVSEYEIFTKADYDYFFDKLAYVDKVFDNAKIKRLNAYYKELYNLERIRFEYQQIKRDYKYESEIEEAFIGFSEQVKAVHNLKSSDVYYLGLIPKPCNVGGLVEDLRRYLGIEEVEQRPATLQELIIDPGIPQETLI